MTKLHQWFHTRQTQALDTAYQAAIALQSIEAQYFNNDRIDNTPQQGTTVNNYFHAQRDQLLTQIRFNLAQMHISGLFSNLPYRDQAAYHPATPEVEIIEKLRLIDAVVDKYRHNPEVLQLSPEASASQNSLVIAQEVEIVKPLVTRPPLTTQATTLPPRKPIRDMVARWQREFSPNYEEEVSRELRFLRRQKIAALRWLFVLLVIPLVVQTTSRTLVFEPILDHFRDVNPSQVAIRGELNQELRTEFQQFKENLEISALLGTAPSLNPSEYQAKLKEKIQELYQEYGYRALNGLKNVLSDILSLGVFIALAIAGRNQLIVLRSVFNRSFLSLSDPTKIYIFILITDMFVGFHSVEGWEVLLGGFANHFGLPENRTFTYGFIATVPVIMDSTVKFWIFNYLTRSSPSAVAIYEKMNQ